MTFVCHPTQVLRANETLHLRRLLRVVEHGTALLDDEQRRTCATAVAATSPSTGQIDQVHSHTGEATQQPPPAQSAAANSTYALPTGVSRGGRDVAGADGSGVGEDGGGRFAGDGPSDVLLPSGGEVVAIKLARVIGGAAVVPPAEGIRKPGVVEEGRGGRKKQVGGGSCGGRRGGGRVMVGVLWPLMSVLALDRCCTVEGDHQFVCLVWLISLAIGSCDCLVFFANSSRARLLLLNSLCAFFFLFGAGGSVVGRGSGQYECSVGFET